MLTSSADVNWLDALVRDLRDEGAIVDVDPTSQRLSVLSYRGQELPTPVLLDFTEEEIAAHLELISADAQEATGEPEPQAAAYHLFLVHLDELFRAEGPSAQRVWLENGRMRSDAKPGLETAKDHFGNTEGWYWSADRPK